MKLSIESSSFAKRYIQEIGSDKKGYHAVKISGNWRIIFEFNDGDAYNVNYDDYH
jgi:proteic killer suppression protein